MSSSRENGFDHVHQFLNDVKTKQLPGLEFKLYDSNNFIPLKFDSQTEEKYGVKFGQRVETPHSGLATVLGESENQLWLKLDRDKGITH